MTPRTQRFRGALAGLGLMAAGATLAALALGDVVPRAGAQESREPPRPITGVTALDLPPTRAGARAGFADVLEPVLRATVQIQSTKHVKLSEQRRGRGQQQPQDWPFPFPNPFGGDDEGGDGSPQEFDSDSLGSGVIVRPDGVILTNNHVVEGADEVRVVLADRRELRAKVVGTDPLTDIAVLRVEAKDLPSLRLGSSSDLRVGDLVFAVGSPFELMQSATTGIVSATGRSDLGITHTRTTAGYENFIQTDAAINKGNSGGPLVDSRGDVVGINTAIYGGMGNVGIGFAVPADLARPVMEQLLAEGKVVRAQLGVALRPVDDALARSYGLDRPEGAIVTRVEKDSPAERAGLRVGDLIEALDDKPVASMSQLRLAIAGRRPGSKVTLGLLDEEGRQRTVQATLRELSDSDQAAGDGTSEESDSSGSVTDEGNALRGIEVSSLDELTPQQRQRLDLPADVDGVLVTRVDRGSPAARAGITPNTVIEQIDRADVGSVTSFKSLAKEHGRGLVRLRILRMTSQGPQTDIVAIEP
jgi:serine protease Do